MTTPHSNYFNYLSECAYLKISSLHDIRLAGLDSCQMGSNTYNQQLC